MFDPNLQGGNPLTVEDLKKAIRDIPDFPEEGVIFKDITPLLNDAELYSRTIDLMTEPFADKNIDTVVCVEARGFIFGAAIADRLGAALVPVRKEGKLPHKTRKVSYSLEYGEAAMEIHEDAIRPGTRVLIVDDLLATGGTLAAAAELIREHGGEIVGVEVLIELDFLEGREKLKGLPLISFLHY